MAASLTFLRQNLATFSRRLSSLNQVPKRVFASEAADPKDAPPPPKEKAGWLTKLLTVRQIDPGSTSHSQMLSDKDTVYELTIHCVKPEFMEKYLSEYEYFVERVNAKKTGADLVGSWTVAIGDQDEAIHLWRYKGGYPVLNNATQVYRTDREFVDFRINRNKMLRSRKNQILLAFSFWGEIEERKGPNIYELRSYVLKPGTMIEWGNNWARVLKSRGVAVGEPLGGEKVGGLFVDLGEESHVYHVWAYESLQSRKEIREAAWQRPGWDDCVAYTVPLIRHMTSRILIPTPFSPLQ